MSSFLYRLRRYRWETAAHWRETATIRDFMRLMQIRLSQSKLGPLVCRQPVTHAVNLASFGGPLWLRSHSSDISIVNEQITHPRSTCHPCYPPILSHTRDCDVVIDLGANTGIVSRWLAHQHPRALVVCVEPAEENLDMLTRNVAMLGDRAVVVPHCIGGVARTVKLATASGAWAYAMTDDGEGIDSDVITMPELLDKHDIDRIGLLKSNIEGAEWEMLEHSGEWIDRVDAMVIELHHEPNGLERFRELAGTDWRLLHRERNPQIPDCEQFAFLAHGAPYSS